MGGALQIVAIVVRGHISYIYIFILTLYHHYHHNRATTFLLPGINTEKILFSFLLMGDVHCSMMVITAFFV